MREMIEKLKELYRHRELLWNMIKKELKVKYKRSVLGFLWSMLNPLIMLVVFSLVFAILAKMEEIPWYAIYLMAGLLPWLFFVNCLMQSVVSVVSNPGLVKKVYFPREILPMATVGANIIHLLLQMLVFFIFLLVIGWHFSPLLVWVPAILLLEITFTLGLALILSASNVYLRDVQHFTEVATMAWFWLCPIVYPILLVTNTFPKFMPIYLSNPMTPIVMVWEQIIYNPWHFGPKSVNAITYQGRLFWIALGGVILLSLFLLVFGYYYFMKKEKEFAEQI